MKINAAITNGLLFLRAEQQDHGGFVSQSSPTQQPWQPQHEYRTTFVPALMLASLSHLEQPTTHEVRNKLAGFLLSQKSAIWSFNYWQRDTAEHKALPYPDDLDDTFCSLAALYLHNNELITEEALANMVKLLIATEQKVGGPYRTWLIAKDAPKIWQDIDLAVNANIAYFVSLVSEPLPNLERYLEQHITQATFGSPYYPVPYAMWYYLARAYHGPKRPALARTIEQYWRQNTKTHSALNAALALTALLRLKPKSTLIPQFAQYLLEAQQPDGSWQAATFYLDIPQAGKSFYHGAPVLSTAFALEALQQYSNGLAFAQKSIHKTSPATNVHAHIMQAATNMADGLGPSVKKPFRNMLTKMAESDPEHEITTLPHLFVQSLSNAQQLHHAEQLSVTLGLANLYGWIAYTIYDDFLDDEGKPELLSVANIALRSSLLQFQNALPDEPQFQKLVVQTFNTMDNANTWEVTHCRFVVTQTHITIGTLPRFGQRQKLAERSLGHGLTPLALLVASGASLHSPQVRAIEQAFRHYLIARQLNDDAHDWKEDAQRGHITYVVAQILRQLRATGDQPFETLLPAMEHQFWNHTLVTVCQTMQQHIARGQALIADNACLAPNNLLFKLLSQTEKSVLKTLKTQKQALSFLENYRGKKVNS